MSKILQTGDITKHRGIDGALSTSIVTHEMSRVIKVDNDIVILTQLKTYNKIGEIIVIKYE